MKNDLRRLRMKLGRELVQAEHDAVIHPRREASRLGDVPPAQAFLAISEHAGRMRPRLEAKLRRDQPVGVRLGRAVADPERRIRIPGDGLVGYSKHFAREARR